MIDKNVDMFSSKNIAVIASIMIIGLGLVIPLLIVVIFAYRKETKTGGVKYEDLRGDTEVTRHL